MKRVIAFDLDGTLVDSVADLARALNGALQEVGRPAHGVDVVRGFVGNGARVLVERALAAHLDAVPGIDVDSADVDDVLARFQRRYADDLAGETRPFAGIAAALDGLMPHAVLAVATNKPGVFARPLVDALLPGRFAVVVGPDDSGVLKPDPRMLAYVERQARLQGFLSAEPPRHPRSLVASDAGLTSANIACFVGDSAVDVDTARAYGVPSVGVTWGLRPDEARGADVVVDDTADLLAALVRLLSSSS